MKDRVMTQYEILNVGRSASSEEIKLAYRKKAFQLHPDRNASPNAHQEFIRVREAFEVLISPERRARYDRKFAIAVSPPIRQDHETSTENVTAGLGGPLEEFLRIYRMSWSEIATFPPRFIAKKLFITIPFAIFYLIFGALFGFSLTVFVGKMTGLVGYRGYFGFYNSLWGVHVTTTIFLSIVKFPMIVLAVFFLFFGKPLFRYWFRFPKEPSDGTIDLDLNI